MTKIPDRADSPLIQLIHFKFLLREKLTSYPIVVHSKNSVLCREAFLSVAPDFTTSQFHGKSENSSNKR